MKKKILKDLLFSFYLTLITFIVIYILFLINDSLSVLFHSSNSKIFSYDFIRNFTIGFIQVNINYPLLIVLYVFYILIFFTLSFFKKIFQKKWLNIILSVLVSLTIIIVVHLINFEISKILVQNIIKTSNQYETKESFGFKNPNIYKKSVWQGYKFYALDHVSYEVLSFPNDSTMHIEEENFFRPYDYFYFPIRYVLNWGNLKSEKYYTMKGDTVYFEWIHPDKVTIFKSVCRVENNILYFPEFVNFGKK